MVTSLPFSARHNYAGAKEITIWEDAPAGLRFLAIEAARELGWQPSRLRALLCRVLREMPNSGNWGEYHALGTLECVARDVTGDPKGTLGEILKRYPGLLPPPLDEALSKIWGYASNEARHVTEGRDISRAEAELLVGLSAVLSTYLAGKVAP